MAMENLTFRQLMAVPSLVDIEIVLQDLLLIDDEIKDKLAREERRMRLAAALRNRNFFRTADQALDMAELFLGLREIYEIDDVESLDSFIREFRLYRFERDMTGT